MTSIIEGMFSIFSPPKSFDYKNVLKKYERNQFKWYHDGPWHEHPFWGDTWKDSKRD
jgi:hypothetical protein